MSHQRRAADEPSDGGQVMLLMVFFAVIVAGLITVIVDISTVFLAQREMRGRFGSFTGAASNGMARWMDVRAMR